VWAISRQLTPAINPQNNDNNTRLTAIFQHQLGKPVPVCLNSSISLELRLMDVAVTTGAVTHAKLRSNCHHQQTNTQLFTGRMPCLSPNQQCQSTEGKYSNIRRWIISGKHL